MLHKIVKLKEIYVVIVRQLKVMDDPLYIGIPLDKEPKGLHIIMDKDQNNWYVLQPPLFLSALALENADIKTSVDSGVSDNLMTDRIILSNILQLLPNILIPIFSTKYPKEICIQMYERALQSVALG